jgi:DNA helicase-2/ATP-dependent DNA helicase PcrA
MKKYYLRRAAPSTEARYSEELNPEQYAAVEHGEGPALVLAGAGSGKTRVVTYRVARLIRSGISPENILLLTFTNKAAREMMRRVEFLIGKNVMGLTGGTFHHVGNLVLRRHYQLAGYREGFSIMDREDSKELFGSCVAEIQMREAVMPKGAVLAEICSLAKNTETGVNDVVLARFPHFIRVSGEIGKIVSLYEKKKLALNLMDFDDLLVNWKKVLMENEKLREYYSLRFRYILVDEYQDTNRLQAEIVDMMAGGMRNLMVVGDDAQSIYSFRGADFENILRFPERYPETAVFKLTTNYRSTPEILALANGIIAHNRRRFEKELHSFMEHGDLPNVVPLRDVFEESAFVSSVVIDLNAEGGSFDDMAVLYRSHYQSMQVQMEFQRKGIPFEVRSGLKFFEQAHIKDILSTLRIIFNPYDEISWKRVLKLIRGIGNVTAARIWWHLRSSENPVGAIPGARGLVPKKSLEGFDRFLDLMQSLSGENFLSRPAEAIEHVLRYGYEDYLYSSYPNAEARIEDIQQMTRYALRYDSLETFLSDMTLQGVSDAEAGTDAESDGRVILSTIHQAKGLEWKTVFIIGMTDGRFPSAKSLKNDDEEEERRLFYVGATRAKESLFLCYPTTSEDWHAIGLLRPSRFLKELPAHCFEEIEVEDV